MNRSTTIGVQGQKGHPPVRDADTIPEIGELERLRAENARLRAMLDAHGIDFLRSSKLQRGSGSSYDQAFRALQDLAEAYAGAKRETTFRRRLVRLMAQHGKRGAWVTRLTKAGYMWEPRR